MDYPFKDIRNMIKRSEETGKLIQRGRGRKPVKPVLIDAFRTAVASQSHPSVLEGKARKVALHIFMTDRLFLQHHPKSA